MFDPKAPIERQKTSGGRQILSICDTGFDHSLSYAVLYSLDGIKYSVLVDKHGRGGVFVIATTPENKPLVEQYVNIYDTGLVSHPNEQLANMSAAFSQRLALVKLSFDPNTNKSSAETLWHKPD